MAAKLFVDKAIMLQRVILDRELLTRLSLRIYGETNFWFKELKELKTPHHFRLSRYGEKYWMLRHATGEEVEGCILKMGNGPYRELPYNGQGRIVGRFVNQFLWWLY